jgi:hypothetical protein
LIGNAKWILFRVVLIPFNCKDGLGTAQLERRYAKTFKERMQSSCFVVLIHWTSGAKAATETSEEGMRRYLLWLLLLLWF